MSAPDRIFALESMQFGGGVIRTWVGSDHMPKDANYFLITPARENAEELVKALSEIVLMKPHHAGQTPNEYHMQKKARALLAKLEAET